MTVLPLVIAPDPRLKICSAPVDTVTDELRRFIDDMIETMYASGGIGLAAVQVGVHKRVLVMDIDYRDENTKGTPLVLINPEIAGSSVEISTYQEGCLSFPGQYADVKRPEKVTVKYIDYNGKSQTMEADGLLATCVQHEMDHLNGITFVDHISALKRDVIMRKLKKAQKAQQD